MNRRYVVRPDTQAWVGQSWGFFAMACSAELAAIWWLDMSVELKMLLSVILAATVYICFALAKTIRDNRDGRKDTEAWIAMTYGMAVAMVCALAYGIFFVSPDWKERLMLGIGLAWTIEASLVLAKTIRDQFEARQDAARMSNDDSSRAAGDYETGKPSL
jgi:hypothetical protein